MGPKGVTVVALSLLAQSKETFQYPEARSNVENHFAPERAQKESSICSREYVSLSFET